MSAPGMERMGVRGASMPQFPRWHQFGKPNDGSFQVCALFREERDADLFGAASELLEALRAMEGRFLCTRPDDLQIVDKARAAIAKAPGGAS